MDKDQSIKGLHLSVKKIESRIEEIAEGIKEMDNRKLEVEIFDKLKHEFRHNHTYVVFE